MRGAALVLLVSAGAAAAQSLGLPGEPVDPLPDFSQGAQDEVIGGGIEIETIDISPTARSAPREAPRTETEIAAGAILRGLDKITGETTDIDLGRGESTTYGRLTVSLAECRFPRENPSGDAFAYLTVTADTAEKPWFEGWMVASSPALSALDHPRYDVWIMRCRGT